MAEHLWLLMAAILVFIMQAGFLCLESGRIRSKNSINVAAKNISDFVISSIFFWMFGFALMFGTGVSGVIGIEGFFFGDTQNPYQVSFFLFQMMFCGTATTLVSGAVAERMTFIGYLAITVVLSAFIYPVAGHWAWAGYYEGAGGWLQHMGFVDFAGSTVVHSVGGWVALAAIIIIGPRLGRFDRGVRLPPGNNLPLSVLGTLLIWLGWFGFNGGSTFKLTEEVPLILLNTCQSAVWGALLATTLHFIRHRYMDVSAIVNGTIAGLVGITASCHAVSPSSAALIGMVSGIVVYFGGVWIERLKIDDALDVVPAHLFAGIWGTIAVAIFGKTELLGTGLQRTEQLVVQLIGVMSIGSYCFTVSYVLIRTIDRYIPLRVLAKSEEEGLNVSEHRATTELIDLLTSMQRQQDEGDFSAPVPEEPFTEVGQIARKYNQVIERVNTEIELRDNAIGQYRSSEKRKSAILDSSMDCIISIDLDGNIIEFNPAAERTFGCLKKQMLGENFIESFVLPADRFRVYSSLRQLFSSSQGLLLNRRNTITLQRSSHLQFPAEITITGTQLDNELRNEFTLHIRDVTRQVKLQDKLKFLAYSDPLTSLYNRTYLMEKLIEAVSCAEQKRESVAILFLDLDKFKKINDTLGHKAGDELLIEVSSRLTKVTRDTDVISRWGGDEFVVMLSGDIDRRIVCEKADDILEVMRFPVEINGREINIPTSIGIALSIYGETEADSMIQHADIAMYNAKERGRDNWQVFEPEMAKQASRHFNYEQEMKEGLKTGQFSVVYQPKICTRVVRGELHKEIVGLEALLRWNHPKEGSISPADFIPLAEESNLIIQLGEFAIHQVLEDLAEWIDSGLSLLPVAINISGKHLVSDLLVPSIKEKLETAGIEGRYLEIEITEGVLLSDVNRCIDVMSDLKDLDIKISIDDFGTGYSSLNYLKRLPIDILKIDQSFVEECATKEEDSQICLTIINLAKNLDLITVAEGVETQEQWEVLMKHGCEVFQGYFFYRPESSQSIKRLLHSLSHSNAEIVSVGS
ncbi:diguanylate cyclase [Hahella sp. CCB-MM4]|uniref:ammonium transporter n=1 Tax=Hahella sp. (strain CCB-MM4) TaxID=1926491 RepID=UPI000B9ACC8D|nr:ammonium transporter [Hahella sp. CCB-MM4]OZG74551.1 diguanylate cyclase [Hahella sp. CCB-MM4]